MANSADPDETPRIAASHLGLRYYFVNAPFFIFFHKRPHNYEHGYKTSLAPVNCAYAIRTKISRTKDK